MLRLFRVVIIQLLMLWFKKIYKVRSPIKVPSHEILGAQHFGLNEKSKFFQSPSPWHLGTFTAQSCLFIYLFLAFTPFTLIVIGQWTHSFNGVTNKPIEELLNLRDVIMIYKCINGLAPNYLSSKLYKRSDTHAHNTRLKEHFSLPLCRTSIAQRNFYYRALKSWNKLSVATRNSSSLAQFKRSARGEMRSAGKWFLILYI